MAKIRDKELSQLRGASVYCPLHGRFKVPVLPSISSPRCEFEGRYSDLLRRSVRKKRCWKHKVNDRFRGLEGDGMDETTASSGSV